MVQLQIAHHITLFYEDRFLSKGSVALACEVGHASVSCSTPAFGGGCMGSFCQASTGELDLGVIRTDGLSLLGVQQY